LRQDWAVVVLSYGDGPGLRTVGSLLEGGVEPEKVLLVHNPGPGAAGITGAPAGVSVRNRSVNDGYGPAMNLGVAWAREQGYDLVALLTDDVEISLDSLQTLAEHCRSPDVAIVGPLLRDRDTGAVLSTGGTLDRWGQVGHRKARVPALAEVEWIDGAALMAKTAVVTFPPDFFLYVEDVAACVAARRAGYRVLCDIRAEAVTSPGVRGRREVFRYLMWRNRVAMAVRMLGVSAVLATVARCVATGAVRAAQAYKTGGAVAARRLGRTYGRALSDGLLGRMGPPDDVLTGGQRTRPRRGCKIAARTTRRWAP
jgi:hypothetical protein